MAPIWPLLPSPAHPPTQLVLVSTPSCAGTAPVFTGLSGDKIQFQVKP